MNSADIENLNLTSEKTQKLVLVLVSLLEEKGMGDHIFSCYLAQICLSFILFIPKY